jgi:hypothetical protein
MPNPSKRPIARPGRVLAVALVASLAVLSSCGGVKTDPRDYGADYEANFMLGCTGIETSDSTSTIPEGGEKLAPKSYCECVYKGLEQKVPFEEAKKFEDDQAKAESGQDIKVPKNIQAVFDGCKGKA